MKGGVTVANGCSNQWRNPLATADPLGALPPDPRRIFEEMKIMVGSGAAHPRDTDAIPTLYRCEISPC